MSQLDRTMLDERSMIVLRNTIAITPAATAANTSAEQTFSAVKATLPFVPRATDAVQVLGYSGNACYIAGARFDTSGNLTIRFSNPTGGSLTHTAIGIGECTILVHRA